ncbi:MAG: MBL fold metallo-hydrolase [Anaerobacillus sp.]
MKYLVILISSLLIILQMPFEVNAETDLADIHFIDVGQADSILITHGEKNMLVDAGDNKDGKVVSNYLKKLGILQLDYVVATHPHHDHIGGMDQILKDFDVGTVVMPDVSYPTTHYEALQKIIKKKDIDVMKAEKGKKIKLGHDINVQILSPPQHAEYEDFNDYSAVLRIKHKKNTFLLMGDAGVEVEKQILSTVKKKHLSSDVLKIGHHGANSATTESFIKVVNPKTAVISVGKNNRYHFPNAVVIQRLHDLNISILRTDQIGTIIASSDGKHIAFHTVNSLISQNKDK